MAAMAAGTLMARRPAHTPVTARRPDLTRRALTLAEYLALEPLCRPLTDQPIGATTTARRHADAMASALVPATRTTATRRTHP